MIESRLRAPLRELGSLRAPGRLLPAVLEKLALGYWYVGLETVIGPVAVVYGPRGIAAVRRLDGDTAAEELRRLVGREVRPAEALPERLERQLRAALSGGRPATVDLVGLTPFQRAVLAKTAEIPRGEVRTYSWIARQIGRPRAVRAVGSALARNPVPLVIPCHRVVRNDWRVGEYSGGGKEAKRAVLASEGVQPELLEDLARRGVRYRGSSSTHTFCVPTCRHARRIQPAHRVDFRSSREAQAAGFRACRVCEPEGPLAVA